jgi:hypothetical protein
LALLAEQLVDRAAASGRLDCGSEMYEGTELEGCLERTFGSRVAYKLA